MSSCVLSQHGTGTSRRAEADILPRPPAPPRAPSRLSHRLPQREPPPPLSSPRCPPAPHGVTGREANRPHAPERDFWFAKAIRAPGRAEGLPPQLNPRPARVPRPGTCPPHRSETRRSVARKTQKSVGAGGLPRSFLFYFGGLSQPKRVHLGQRSERGAGGGRKSAGGSYGPADPWGGAPRPLLPAAALRRRGSSGRRGLLPSSLPRGWPRVGAPAPALPAGHGAPSGTGAAGDRPPPKDGGRAQGIVSKLPPRRYIYLPIIYLFIYLSLFFVLSLPCFLLFSSTLHFFLFYFILFFISFIYLLIFLPRFDAHCSQRILILK